MDRILNSFFKNSKAYYVQFVNEKLLIKLICMSYLNSSETSCQLDI